MVFATIDPNWGSGHPDNWIAAEIPYERLTVGGQYLWDAGKDVRMDAEDMHVIDPKLITFYFCDTCRRGYEGVPKADITLKDMSPADIAHEELVTCRVAVIGRLHIRCGKCEKPILSIPIHRDEKIPKDLEHLIIKTDKKAKA